MLKKKKCIVVFTCMIGGLLLSLAAFSRDYHGSQISALEAFHQQGERINLVNSFQTENGAIVFYYLDNDKTYLLDAFLVKNLFGWKYVYGGVSGIEGIPARVGFTTSVFPAVKGLAHPFLLGKIADDSIRSIRVEAVNSDAVKHAQILDVGEISVWIVSLDELDGTAYTITAYSEDGDALYDVEETIPDMVWKQ